MIKSKTQLSLQEMNEQIQMIVKGDSENATSYFPNAEMVLESFENYLECCDVPGRDYKCKVRSRTIFYVFQQSLSSPTLLKYQKFLNLLLHWQFSFTSLLSKLFSNQVKPKTTQHYLHEINLTEIVFLMYLSLEVQRKQIIGQLTQYGKTNNMFLLKEIVNILDQVYANGRNKSYGFGCNKKESSFSINQDQFVKVLLLKALKIKLQKQNFSFHFNSESKYLQTQQQYQKQNIQKHQNTMNNNADVTFSLISIESQYNKSDINQQPPKSIKQNLNMISSKLNQRHLELERKNLSSQQIFKYISLNESKGYIDR